MSLHKHVNRVLRVEGETSVLQFGEHEVLIDTADLPVVTGLHWTPVLSKRARPGTFYFVAHGGLRLHRLLTDAPDSLTVDHRNHDTRDNRRSNLRVVTNQVNNANRAGPYATNKTGVRGLSVHHKADGRDLYVVRCHIVTCKVARYFSFGLDGYREAVQFAQAHFAGLPDKPAPRRTKGGSESGVPGVHVLRVKRLPGYVRYQVVCQRRACRVSETFPYTPEGLEAARRFLEEHDALVRTGTPAVTLNT